MIITGGCAVQKLENKQRLDWLDVLKCIAMFAVITGHAANGETPDTLKFYIYSFHMPLFFIISGMTFYIQTSRRDYSISEMFINKCRTLLWPYLIFNLLVLPLWYVYFKLFDPSMGTIKGLLISIFYSNPTWSSLPISASWFLTTLFLAMMLFFVVIKACKGKDLPVFILCALLGIGGYITTLFDATDISWPWHLPGALIACMLVMMGYLFMKHLNRFDEVIFGANKNGPLWAAGSKTIVIAVLWIVGALIAGCVIARFNAKISMNLNDYGNFVLFIGAVVAFSLMFYVLSRMIPPLAVFKLVGRNTIVYLCTHELGIIAMTVLSSATNHFVTSYPVLAALVIFIALLPVAYVVERWLPFLIGRKPRKS